MKTDLLKSDDSVTNPIDCHLIAAILIEA